MTVIVLNDGRMFDLSFSKIESSVNNQEGLKLVILLEEPYGFLKSIYARLIYTIPADEIIRGRDAVKSGKEYRVQGKVVTKLYTPEGAYSDDDIHVVNLCMGDTDDEEAVNNCFNKALSYAMEIETSQIHDPNYIFNDRTQSEQLDYLTEVASTVCKDCPNRKRLSGDVHSLSTTLLVMIRHICATCEVNPLASSVIRFLLDSKNIEKARSYKEIEEHTKDIPIIPMTLSNVLNHFESCEYIQADDTGLWSITQKGIDRFFRVEEGE